MRVQFLKYPFIYAETEKKYHVSNIKNKIFIVKLWINIKIKN